MVEEDPDADVGEHCPVGVALDVPGRLLLLRADAEEAQELVEVGAADRQRAGEDGDCDPDESERPDARERAPTPRGDGNDDDAEEHGSDAREGAGEDDAEGAGAGGQPGQLPLTAAAGAERDRDQRERESRRRERGEVVHAEKRRLALAGTAPFELVDEAEELEQPPPGRGRAPHDQ